MDEMAKAGFWRRALAFLIDSIVVYLVLQIVAVVGFQLTDGRMQLSGGNIWSLECTRLTGLPAGIGAVPFEPNYSFRCLVTVLGMPTARTATVGRATQDVIKTNIWITVAVDDQGRVINVFPLDCLWIPLLVALRWWRDRVGASPGRRVVRTHVEVPSIVKRPGLALAKRYLFFMLLWLPGLGFQVWWSLAGNVESAVRILAMAAAVGMVTLIVFVVAVVIPIVRRRDAFYDRWAGTAVELNDP